MDNEERIKIGLASILYLIMDNYEPGDNDNVDNLLINICDFLHNEYEMTKDERINVIESLNDSINAIKKAKVAEEVLLIQEEKADHFHIWIVPTHEWMKDIGRSVRNIKKFVDYAKEHFGEKEKEELLKAIEDIKEVYGK